MLLEIKNRKVWALQPMCLWELSIGMLIIVNAAQ